MQKTLRQHLQDDPAYKIFKAFPAEAKAVDDMERQFRFTITTNGVDREKDVITADGWKVENYLKNPVVLWAHDYRQPPVGVSRSLERTENGLASVCEFADPKDYALAGTVAALVRMGALRATSVGFRTLEWTWDEQRDGINFISQELLEYSIVPVPANPECLIEARGEGIDVEPLREWAAKTLEMLVQKDAPAPIPVPDLTLLKKNLDDVTGSVERFTLLIDGLGQRTAVLTENTERLTALIAGVKTDSGVAVDDAVAPSVPATSGNASETDGTPVPDDEDDEDQDDEINLTLEDDTDPEVTPEQLADLRAALTELTKQSVETAWNKRRGRID